MNKTLCLGMIVKNESLNIKKTLESVRPIIDYWILCDTGSTDNTEEIAKEVLKGIPGEYIHRPWVNFGYNRSEVAILTKDKADYSLMLDADFLVELNGFDKNKLVDDQYDLIIKWFGTSFYNPLLFSNRLSWKSVGVVHEYWYAEGIKTRSKFSALSLNHDRHGPARPKGLHDLKLLEQGVIDEPNNARYHFYLANTLRDVGEYKRAIEIFSKRISMGGWEEEIFYSKYQIGYCFELMHEINKAKIAYLKAWEYRPSRSEPLCKLAALCRVEKDYNQAYLFAKKGMEIPYPNDIIFVDRPTYQYLLRFEKSIAAYWLGKWEEAIEDSKFIDEIEGILEEIKILNRKNILFSEANLNKVNLSKKFPGEGYHSIIPFNNRSEEVRKQNMIDMKEIVELYKSSFNIDLYIVYGTLLGAIRENGFILTDDDIDFAYLSKYTTEAEVRKEVEEINWELRRKGLMVTCRGNGGQVRVSSPSNKTVVDVWTSWIENGVYHIIPYKKLEEISITDIYPLKSGNLNNNQFNIPCNSEKLLNSFYVDWNIPKTKKEKWSKLPNWSYFGYNQGGKNV